MNILNICLVGINAFTLGIIACTPQAKSVIANDIVCLINTYEADSLNGMSDAEAILDAALKCGVEQGYAQQVLGAHIAGEQKKLLKK